MTIWILTLFPEFFEPLLNCGVVGKFLRGERGQKTDDDGKKVSGPRVKINIINIRDFAQNSYKNVDDYPFGGGHGQVMRADTLARALKEGVAKKALFAESDEQHDLAFELPSDWQKKFLVILPTPRGKIWNNEWAQKLARTLNDAEKSLEEIQHVVFICGRYEGIDERFIKLYVNEEYSLGDFVVSGGEIPVMSMIDSTLRFLPGTLGSELGAQCESFQDNLLEGPQYTRPSVFEGESVPEILLSGHHKLIVQYQHQERLRVTGQYRPDLLEKKKV
jgi:tRNA (guanine37-N1)-methyltransferase